MTDLMEAVVHAGPLETAYVRAGSGTPVLLLIGGSRRQVAGSPIFLRLRQEFRVIAPALIAEVWEGGEAPASVRQWLCDLIEALGLERPALVVDAPLLPVLQPLLGAEGERLGPIAGAPRHVTGAALEAVMARLRTAMANA